MEALGSWVGGVLNQYVRWSDNSFSQLFQWFDKFPS